MNKLTISVYCWRYQRRLWWQLSSLVNQPGIDIKYILNVCKDDPYDYLTQEIINTFSNLLNLEVKYYSYNDFQTRGHTRNITLKENGGWILFTDVDMIFSNGFFNDLFKTDLAKYDISKPSVFSTGRWFTGIEDGYKLAETVDFMNVIFDYDKILDGYPMYFRRGRGSGNFQLVNKDIIGDIEYPSSDKPLKRYLCCYSDKHFRSKIGNTIEIKTTGKIFHIYHYIERTHGSMLSDSILPL